jgi:hypothetical protein
MACVDDIECPKQRGADGQVGSVISPIINRNLQPLGLFQELLKRSAPYLGTSEGGPIEEFFLKSSLDKIYRKV